jgi:hypothetical protein
MSRNFAIIAPGKGDPNEQNIFLVEEPPEGGYTAKALGESIFARPVGFSKGVQ